MVLLLLFLERWLWWPGNLLLLIACCVVQRVGFLCWAAVSPTSLYILVTYLRSTHALPSQMGAHLIAATASMFLVSQEHNFYDRMFFGLPWIFWLGWPTATQRLLGSRNQETSIFMYFHVPSGLPQRSCVWGLCSSISAQTSWNIVLFFSFRKIVGTVSFTSYRIIYLFKSLIKVIDPKCQLMVSTPGDHLKHLESLCDSWSLLRWIGAQRPDVQAFVQMTRLLVHSPGQKNIMNITTTLKIAAKQRSVAHLESSYPTRGSEGM